MLSDAAGVVMVIINDYVDLVFIHLRTYTFMLPLNTLVLVKLFKRYIYFNWVFQYIMTCV